VSAITFLRQEVCQREQRTHLQSTNISDLRYHKCGLLVNILNLFLCFGQGVYRQCIGIPMGTNCVVYLANLYLFTYEFDFIKCLLNSNTCPVVLHRLSLVRRFVDDLFVPDFPDFVKFMYLNQDSFGSSIYPKTSCELNYTSKGFSCNFLDLAVSQSPQGLSCDIFDKCSQPEYEGIEMIRMPHVHSNISMTAKLGVINSQFTDS
jgi:hypothetical protein